MSAIWGLIPFHNQLPQDIDTKMRRPYEEKCKIERMETKQDANCYMGCGIQYITDEAEREILPIFDNDRGIYFTADCILDNRDELIRDLAVSPSEPDGTLIYLAYLKWGIDCLPHLRGLFSFAVYDREKQVAYLAADQMSSRCLYFRVKNGTVTFSTLLSSIRNLHSDIGINEFYIKDFLTAPGLAPNVVSNETPYQAVFKLNPGTYQKITASCCEEVSYWTPAMPSTVCHCHTPKEYGAFFRSLYENCVKDALRTNGKVGISLSSGLDSASVGVLAATFLAKADKKLYSYTYVPYEKPSPDKNRHNVHDETGDVMKIARLHPNIVPHFLNNGGRNCFEGIPRGVQIMEIPYKAYGNLPSLFEVYADAAKEGCKIVLTGQMGNSTVSNGYIDDVLYDLWLRKKYVSFLRYLNHYSKTVKESRKQALRSCRRYFRHTKEEYTDSSFSYTPDNLFLSEQITENYPLKERFLQAQVPTKGRLPSPGSLYREHLYLKQAFTYLGELDTKAGLAHGILLRDPTRDMRMLSFCYHLPYHLFACHGVPRWLIRNNLRDVLPTELLDDWMRYGVQNSDCHKRLMRDWKTILPQLQEHLSSPRLQPYLNSQKTKEFLKKASETLSEQEEEETLYLLMLEVLSCFLTSTLKGESIQDKQF